MNARIQYLFSATLFIFTLFLAIVGHSNPECSGPAINADGFKLIALPQTLRSSEVTLYWDKVGESNVTEYHVFRDGVRIAATNKTHYCVENLDANKRYAFNIAAKLPSCGSPQQSNEIIVKTKPAETTISIETFGAKGDGTTLNTEAIQAAINACPVNGVLLVPKGKFLTGALFLKSDMTILIAKDGVLKGTSEPKDYLPLIRNRFEGWEMDTHASLLNAGTIDSKGAANVRNISIRGEGTISGGGRALSDAIKKTHGVRGRGRLICLMNCANVEIRGVSLEATPCWTLHYIYSENVTCYDIKIHSNVHNGDGIDPDSSVNSYIINCTFDTGDDCIAIKSGKNPEGNVVNRPTENVKIVDCNFIRGHGISIGSEISGGVRDVLVQDCVAGNLLHGMQIKGTKDRGGVVENVIVRDCDLQQITIYTDLPYNNDGEPASKQPWFRNFRFQNIDLSKANAAKPVIVVNGFPAAGHRTKNVVFENVKLPVGAIVEVEQAEDITFNNVTTEAGTKPLYSVTRSERVTN